MVFSSSIDGRRRRVMPIAHNGASCGSRELLRVSRLVSNAMPATPSVKALSAAVTAKVRLKMRVDSAFSVAWSGRLRPSRPNLACSAVDQRRNRRRRDAQAHSRLRNFGKMPEQRGEIDGDLALGIAVVSIDGDDVERPVAARRWQFDAVAEFELEPPRQLLADSRRCRTQPVPMPCQPIAATASDPDRWRGRQIRPSLPARPESASRRGRRAGSRRLRDAAAAMP